VESLQPSVTGKVNLPDAARKKKQILHFVQDDNAGEGLISARTEGAWRATSKTHPCNGGKGGAPAKARGDAWAKVLRGTAKGFAKRLVTGAGRTIMMRETNVQRIPGGRIREAGTLGGGGELLAVGFFALCGICYRATW